MTKIIVKVFLLFALMFAGYEIYIGSKIGHLILIVVLGVIALWIFSSIFDWFKHILENMPNLKDWFHELFHVDEKHGCGCGLALILPLMIGALIARLLTLFGISYDVSLKWALITIYSIEGIIVIGSFVSALWLDIFN